MIVSVGLKSDESPKLGFSLLLSCLSKNQVKDMTETRKRKKEIIIIISW